MKKRLLATIMVVGLVLGMAGCGSSSAATPVTTESETEATMWPRDGAAGLIPTPNNESGKVDMNSSDYFGATVTDYSSDLFKEYVKSIKKAGFTEDFIEYDDYYTAEDSNGNSVILSYSDQNTKLSIDVYANTKTESDRESETEKVTESETESAAPETSEVSNDEIRPETKEALDSYEEFMGEYVDFMKKYNENSSDATLLKDYASYMLKYADMTDKFNKMEDDLNDAELSYYLKVQARVLDKLSEIQ